MSKRKEPFKASADVQDWPATMEACKIMEADPALSDADRLWVAWTRQALGLWEPESTLKQPSKPPKPIKRQGESPSATERVSADRDASNLPSFWDPSWIGTMCPSCGHLHPTTAELIATLARTRCVCGAPLRSVSAEVLADYQAGKITTLNELWAKIDAAPKAFEETFPVEDPNPIREGILRHMRGKHGLAPETVNIRRVAEVMEEIARASRHFMENASPDNRLRLESAITDATSILAQGWIDKPTMDEINTEVKAVRHARKSRRLK